MTSNLKDMANTYFTALKAHDFDTVRSLFSDDIMFIGALAEARGVDECISGLRGLMSITTDMVIQHIWADDSNVITWYELHTPKTSKPLSVVNWSYVENARITKMRVVFDPRPLLA